MEPPRVCGIYQSVVRIKEFRLHHKPCMTLLCLTLAIIITISRVQSDRLLLINSRYLGCRCSVTCFNLDKPQEVRHIGVVVFIIRYHNRVSVHTVYD